MVRTAANLYSRYISSYFSIFHAFLSILHAFMYISCISKYTSCIYVYFMYSIDEMLDIYLNGLTSDSKRKRRQELPPVRSMETLVYVDSGVVSFHGTDIIVQYIMAMMNIVRKHCDT